MKYCKWQMVLATVVITGLGVAGATAQDQSAPAANPPPAAAVNTPALQLAYGVPQIVQLAQAKINDPTIIAYIHNSGLSYNLDANQIIYLRQQGVSDVVITTMLSQARPQYSNYSAPTAPAPAPATYTQPTTESAPAPVQTVAPSVTYVQTAPAPTYYYAQPYYYPAYGYGYPYGYYGGYYSPVSVSVGWGWGWGWGGGWRGGWGGGWGGGWHGGGGWGGHGGGWGGHGGHR